MQRRRITYWLVLLMGTLGMIVTGCVAPDGTLYVPQVLGDGTRFGWQVAVPPATDIENAAGTAPRPILYIDGGPDLPIRTVDRAGNSLGIAANGRLLGWSHQGDRFAFIPPGDGSQPLAVVVATLGQASPVTAAPTPDVTLSPFGRLSIWSPDDTQLALPVSGDSLQNGALQIVLVDSLDGHVIREFTLPDEALLDYFYLMSAVPVFPNLSWSPTGQKLLWGLGSVMVIDVESGVTEIIVGPALELGVQEMVVLSEWLPAGDGLLYADGVPNGGQPYAPPQLWRIGLTGEQAVPVLTAEQLLTLGMDENDQLTFKLSPSGVYLALVGVNPQNEEEGSPSSTLWIFDFAALLAESVAGTPPPPIAQWELPGIIGSVTWGPDEQDLAFFMATDERASIEVMAWKEGTSQTVGELVLPPDIGLADLVPFLVSGTTLVSWTP